MSHDIDREVQDNKDVAAVKEVITRLQEHADEAERQAQEARERLHQARRAVQREHPWHIPGIDRATIDRLAEWGGWGDEILNEINDTE